MLFFKCARILTKIGKNVHIDIILISVKGIARKCNGARVMAPGNTTCNAE